MSSEPSRRHIRRLASALPLCLQCHCSTRARFRQVFSASVRKRIRRISWAVEDNEVSHLD
eukprot:31397-Pelagococcus_subviridis.AAC.7